MILEAKKIEFEKLDIAASEDLKKKMRDLIGDPKALPPQLFNDDQYCGVSDDVSVLYGGVPGDVLHCIVDHVRLKWELAHTDAISCTCTVLPNTIVAMAEGQCLLNLSRIMRSLKKLWSVKIWKSF